MRLRDLLTIFGALAIFVLAGCVTVNVGPGDDTKAKNVTFSQPLPPYVENGSKDADKAWQSSVNGNTISYHSACREASDPSLVAMQSNTLRGLENLKVLDEKRYDYNGREALDTLATGTVDGVLVKIRLVVFKKNGCNFDISYVALAKHYATDEKVFDKFISGFIVP